MNYLLNKLDKDFRYGVVKSGGRNFWKIFILFCCAKMNISPSQLNNKIRLEFYVKFFGLNLVVKEVIVELIRKENYKKVGFFLNRLFYTYYIIDLGVYYFSVSKKKLKLSMKERGKGKYIIKLVEKHLFILLKNRIK
jgi:hypothetical protein